MSLPAMPEGKIFNSAVSGDADILGADLNLPADYDSLAVRVTVGISSTTAILRVAIDDGTTTEKLDFNGGTALTTGSLYTFTFGAMRADAGGDLLGYNFELSAGTTIDYMLVEFIRDGVI